LPRIALYQAVEQQDQIPIVTRSGELAEVMRPCPTTNRICPRRSARCVNAFSHGERSGRRSGSRFATAPRRASENENVISEIVASRLDLKQTGLYISDMTKSRSKSSDARQRIVATAERLFYADGVRAVGIDRIIAEAEVAKMSLYNHFPSKDDLILAVLQYREEKFGGQFSTWMERRAMEGLSRLGAFFAALKDWFESPAFRGCMFINTRVELADSQHPASEFSACHKERFHKLLHAIIEESEGAKSAQTVAPAIAMLVEGAIVTAMMTQSSRSADVARDAALALVANSKRK
jgi:AcrR family transcriptional regulator